jgi:putative membrane-bound dehydrogenase-like protein
MRTVRHFRLLIPWLVLWVGSPLLAAAPQTNTVGRGVVSKTDPGSAFLVGPGFRVELVAAEPLVASPVALAFDEDGRLFVAEMPATSGRPDAGSVGGRVRLLQGRDEQGKFLASTVLAENMTFPSALACYAGGVFVASTPNIVFLKDGTGGGLADLRRDDLSGFGGSDSPAPRALLNNFNWGLTARIFGATAGMGGLIGSSGKPGDPISIEGHDFSFNPRTLEVFLEAGPGQSGLSFDNSGRKFVCDPGHPVRLATYEPRYWARNPFFVKPAEVVDVVGAGTAIFPLAVPGSPKLGAPPAGPLLNAGPPNAQGLLVYRGNAFPTNYSENVFVCTPDEHAIHRLVLREEGLRMSAARAANQAGSEFLRSRDSGFRPVQAINGPDGAIYVADARDGGGRGRIHRIVWENLKLPTTPQLGTARIYDLVAALANPNAWHRETAARLLFERQDAAAVPLLGSMLTNSVSAVGRLHAAHVLATLGALKEGHVLKLLQDPIPGLRQNALILAEALLDDGTSSGTLWQQMKQLASDPSIRVRCQLAFSLGAARRPERVFLLAQILARDPANEWIQGAVLSSLGEGAGAMARLLLNDGRFRNDPVGMAFLRRLVEMTGTRGRAEDVSQVVEAIHRGSLTAAQLYQLTASLGEGLHRTRSSLALVDPSGVLAPVFTSALAVAVDATVPESLRVEAVRVLGVSTYTYHDTSDWLLLMSSPHPLTKLRSAAIATLGRYDDYRLTSALLGQWGGLDALLRRQAVMALLARGNRVPAVVAALERGSISPLDLPAQALNFLRTHSDPEIARRALRVLGPVPVHRPELVNRFKPALGLRGFADPGRNIFNSRCAGCHQLGGTEQFLGPDLGAVRTAARERILSDIIEPHASVSREYAACVVETEEGELLIGRKSDEDASSITVRQEGAAPAVWPRLNVRSAQTQTWSLMPEGLEQGLSLQDMASLLEYLTTAPR